MLRYSQRCHFVYRHHGGDNIYPCSLEKDHQGKHRDGYGHEQSDEKRWFEHLNYYAQYEELYDRCIAAERNDLLIGLKP